MGDVSFNLSKAKQITEDIDNAVDDIKKTIEVEWENLQTKFRSNWVGEDEDAFENELLKNITGMFQNVDTVARSTGSFIVNVANAFAEFSSNIAQNFGGAAVNKLSEYTTSARNLDISKVVQSFSEATQRGLVAEKSEEKLIEALTEFCNNVSNKIKDVYSKMEPGEILVSNMDRQNSIKKFLDSIGQSSSTLTGMLDSFKKETIPNLVAAYRKQHETISSQIDTEQTNIESEISSVVSN